ncbi:thioredoxin [Streptococcus hyointestinalis]|uniref:thioredoxin n=1 Tax=Streptococcus hyointestinalis TaxID=1337 RepID=UPI003514D61E
MTGKFSLLRLICGTLLAFGILVFVVIGMQDTWRDHVAKDYDKHLTEQVYVEAVVNQNANLVFYRTGCPYCEAGKTAVVVAAQKSAYPTFYIDVESKLGQQLVKKYHVEVAATLIQIRDGKTKLFHYAMKTSAGKYQPKTESIEEAFND